MMLHQGQCEPCQVCGEQSSGLHCNAVTCEACKKFFLRSIHGEHKKYKCSRAKDCIITRNTRTQCQYCRFDKCVAVGMSAKANDGQTPTVVDLFKQISCYVCGAASSGIHFGAITCEGCKGFFRRSIKERAPGRYQCQEKGDCDVTVTTRSVCKHCRFQKCLKVGMSVDASRIGRQSNLFKHHIMRMQKNGQIPSTVLHAMSIGGNGFRRGRKRRLESISTTEEDPDPTICLSDEEKLTSRQRDHVRALRLAFAEGLGKPPPFPSDQANTWHAGMAQLKFYASAAIKFVREIQGFTALPNTDQLTLLRLSVNCLVLLGLYRKRGVTSWNYMNCSSKEDALRIKQCFPPFGNLKSDDVDDMLRWIDNFLLDINEFVLFLAVIVMTSAVRALSDFDQFQAAQQSVVDAMMSYMECRRGDRCRDFYLLMFIVPQVQRLNKVVQMELEALVNNQPDHKYPTFFWRVFVGKDADIEYKWDVMDILQQEIPVS